MTSRVIAELFAADSTTQVMSESLELARLGCLIWVPRVAANSSWVARPHGSIRRSGGPLAAAPAEVGTVVGVALSGGAPPAAALAVTPTSGALAGPAPAGVAVPPQPLSNTREV